MDYSDFFRRIKHLDLRMNMPMSTLTTFHIGGPANVIIPKSREETLLVTQAAEETDTCLTVIGNGSNLLVADEGVCEPVLVLNHPFEELQQNECTLTAPAGMLLSVLAKESVKRGFTGLEWANGIPGTIGGALAMNAGAYGGELSQAVSSVCYIQNGRIVEEKAEKEKMAYRKSPYCAPSRICLSACFTLSCDDGNAQERMRGLMQKRIAKQPLNYPSAGSVFKRPEGAYAGALIEKAGLKGARVGGAQVSELHAGFIINTGGATCRDVKKLIGMIQRRVYEESGIMLEPEVKMIGTEV